MNPKNIIITLAIVFLISFTLTSALIVDSNYVTIYPGEETKITLDIENNENFDIEEVSVRIELEGKKIYNEFGILTEEIESLPFTIVGSSEKDVDDIDEDDDDKVTFTLRASTDIVPGDYNIPFTIKYVNADNEDEYEQKGSFGTRVSAETEIDFVAETKDAIVGQSGKISLKIINKGLGEIKFVSVQIFEKNFELISTDKIYLGTIDSDDTDTASFDVIFKNTDVILSAKVEYKDFDNNIQTETITLPVKVYTKEEALELGLISKNNAGWYIGIVALIIIIWFVWRKIKKARKKNKGR